MMRDMVLADLEQVLAIEQRVHHYPWTRGNFMDALNSKYLCRVDEEQDQMVGYIVFMPVVDEMHLLNISIAAEYQRQGRATALLNEMLQAAQGLNMQRIILEVRSSNLAALALYRNAGFNEFAVRRNYYPTGIGREDAVVMECKL